MKLGKAEPLGIFNQHDDRVRDIHAHLDYRGGNQQIQFPAGKGPHYRFLFSGLHPPMEQADPIIPEFPGLQALGIFYRGGQAGLAGFIFYQGAHDVSLQALV